jgi:hypothetical protein
MGCDTSNYHSAVVATALDDDTHRLDFVGVSDASVWLLGG